MFEFNDSFRGFVPAEGGGKIRSILFCFGQRFVNRRRNIGAERDEQKIRRAFAEKRLLKRVLAAKKANNFFSQASQALVLRARQIEKRSGDRFPIDT
jgi:hypothetical protein